MFIFYMCIQEFLYFSVIFVVVDDIFYSNFAMDSAWNGTHILGTERSSKEETFLST